MCESGSMSERAMNTNSEITNFEVVIFEPGFYNL